MAANFSTLENVNQKIYKAVNTSKLGKVQMSIDVSTITMPILFIFGTYNQVPFSGVIFIKEDDTYTVSTLSGTIIITSCSRNSQNLLTLRINASTSYVESCFVCSTAPLSYVRYAN